ncbi:MAG: efflux RND transporter periplasmic adaptor subunit [Pseudomonadota bacterium]
MAAERAMIAAVLLAALGTGCRGREEAEAPAGKRPVRCAPVETAEVEDTIELRGTVAPLPDRDAEVAPQVAGRIAKVAVREGERVTAGQPLARIDDAGLVDQANEAAAAVAKAEAERRNAEATRARTERVFEHGIAARQEVEDAVTRADTAAASEREARAAAARIRRQVDRATVRSPLAGIVVRIFRRTGELVDGTPSTPVVEVADPSRLELAAEATAADLVRLAAGAPAEVTTAALPGARWSGAVSVVSPAVDRATGLGKVRIGIMLEAAPRPPIGVLGAARIRLGRPRAATVVPKAALRNGAGADVEVVVCGQDGVAHVRRAARGVSTGDRVEVGGLAAGQSVALDPVGIADGEAIELRR